MGCGVSRQPRPLESEDLEKWLEGPVQESPEASKEPTTREKYLELIDEFFPSTAGKAQAKKYVDRLSSKNQNEVPKMIILRGPPKTGKSSFTRKMMDKMLPKLDDDISPLVRTLIHDASTDDFVLRLPATDKADKDLEKIELEIELAHTVDDEGINDLIKRAQDLRMYEFDPSEVGEFHDKNKERVRLSAELKISPIFVDNTNIKLKWMSPYVQIAQKFGYEVAFKNPTDFKPEGYKPSKDSEETKLWDSMTDEEKIDMLWEKQTTSKERARIGKNIPKQVIQMIVKHFEPLPAGTHEEILNHIAGLEPAEDHVDKIETKQL